MSILFVGRKSLGGALMRGRDVAMRLKSQGFDALYCPWENLLPTDGTDTVVVVKYWTPQIRELRKRCQLLIGDPLDCFSQLHPKMNPPDFWKWYYGEVRPDVILATSPACADTMEGCGAKVVLAPHHADERIGTDWYDSCGPIVYAGGERFLGSETSRINDACTSLHRRLLLNFRQDCWQSLRGAALSLCVRFGNERTPLNLYCKPTVKIANAARAGIPVIATFDKAITSLQCGVNLRENYEDWRDAIQRTLGTPRPAYSWTLDTHCKLIRSLASA